MVTNLKTVEQEISASQAARQALAETDNIVAAAKLLEQWAVTDQTLQFNLTEPYLPTACYEAIRRQSHREREIVWLPPNYTKGGNGQRILEYTKSLLDFRLPNGMRLRDAKKADLIEARDFYSKQAANMQHKVRWLDSIIRQVGRKTAGNAFTDMKLRELQLEVSDD